MPYDYKADNYLEIFNEEMIFISTVLLITYSEMVDSNQAKYEMGFVQIYILGLYVSVNLIYCTVKLF